MDPSATPRRRRPRLRPALAWLHRWAGLVVGTVFALVALAGSVLVFHTELLLLEHPELARHQPEARGAVMARLLADESRLGITALDLPRAELPVWQAYLADGRRAYFAPGDGSLLLVRDHRDDWLMWLHHWHVELLGGATGKEILGIAGWIALGLLLSGLWLWWPNAGRLLAQLRWHSGPPLRRWLSWHRSSGVLLLPLLLLATLTGVGMIHSAGFRSVLVGALGEREPPAPTAGTDAAASAVDWDAVLARARQALPGARLARVSPEASTAPVIVFRARAAGEWHPVGRSLVGVTRDGGRVALRVDATKDAAGARLSNAIYPLHVAAVGGWPMRIALALTGLLPAFLLVTGLLYWTGRRARKRVPGADLERQAGRAALGATQA